MVLVTREILAKSNPSFYNIPDTTVEDTARRSRRAARRAALQARARRRAAQRKIQARRIAARRKARREAQLRRRSRVISRGTPARKEIQRKQVGILKRRGDPRTAGDFPIFKDVEVTIPATAPVVQRTVKTKRQLRVEALNRRFLARRAARAAAARRKAAARRARALRRRRRRRR